jgi:hypothetical protein
MNRISLIRLSLVATASAFSLQAQVVAPAYSGSYTLTDLGSVAGVAAPLGGITLENGNPNTLLIGGAANTISGQIYSIGVTRDVDNHITGFTGTAGVFSDGFRNDGGLAYGPGGDLFYTQYNNNAVGQIKPGSTITDKAVDLNALGYASSVGGLAFVPAGHNGAGDFKLVVYTTASWYSPTLTPDGSGTYDISAAGPAIDLGVGVNPEGVAYVPIGSPLFPNDTLLVSEYQSGRIDAFDTDANGDPIPASRRDFITGLSGAEGAFIDPLTGDFLFSTFGGGNHVVRISGFAPILEPEPQPEPGPTGAPDAGSTFGLLAFGLAAIAARRKS